MNYANLTKKIKAISLKKTLISLTSLIAILTPSSAYPQNRIDGDCNVQVANSVYVRVAPIYCYPNSNEPLPPPISVDSTNPVSVILGGGWWVHYYDREFGEYKGSEELPNQVRNGDKVGVDWGGRRPSYFGQGRGVTFSAEVYGRRFFNGGKYCFKAYTDNSDYVRVYLNEGLMLSNWHPIPGGSPEGCFDIPRGLYSIKIEYKHTGDMAKLQLEWQRDRLPQ